MEWISMKKKHWSPEWSSSFKLRLGISSWQCSKACRCRMLRTVQLSATDIWHLDILWNYRQGLQDTIIATWVLEETRQETRAVEIIPLLWLGPSTSWWILRFGTLSGSDEIEDCTSASDFNVSLRLMDINIRRAKKNVSLIHSTDQAKKPWSRNPVHAYQLVTFWSMLIHHIFENPGLRLKMYIIRSQSITTLCPSL